MPPYREVPDPRGRQVELLEGIESGQGREVAHLGPGEVEPAQGSEGREGCQVRDRRAGKVELPERYEHMLGETSIDFRYRTVKLWGYNGRWKDLEQDPNPIALVVMAHLKTKATRGNAPERLRWKVELVRQLYGRGYSREDVFELFRLLDWLLTLPAKMEKRFRRKLDELEQESQMRYVTSIERLSREEGLEEGLEKGRKEGYLEIVLSQAEERFGPLDESLRKTVQEAPVDQIMEWAKRLLRASSLDEVFAT